MKANCAELSRYNGTDWDLIKRRTNISIGNRDKEVVEGESTLDCTAGASDGKTYEPGEHSGGEWSVSLIKNHDPTPANNPEFHHLLKDDYKTDTATFFKVKLADGTGYLVHAFVKTEGDMNLEPNSDIIAEYTIQPTGAMVNFYIQSGDVDAETLPVGITAPQANYTAG
jgi:hypothetical protein